MRSIITISLLALAICSCVTVKTLNEPDRTQLYIQCLMSGRSMTTCTCLENKGIEKSGISTVKSPEDVKALVEAINNSLTECEPQEEEAK